MTTDDPKTTGQHIVSAFDDDLIAVQAKISEMGGLAEELLSNALDAVAVSYTHLTLPTILLV